jgi:hypothetical protein
MKLLLTNRRGKSMAIEVWDAMGILDAQKIAAHYGFEDGDLAVRLHEFSDVEEECSASLSMSLFKNSTPIKIRLVQVEDWWAMCGRPSGYSGILDSEAEDRARREW